MSGMEGYRSFFKEEKGEIFDANKKGGTYLYEFLSLGKLKPGTYYFKLLPKHPEFAEEGYLYYATHSIPDGSEYGKTVRCTYNGKPGSCYICDFRKALEKSGSFKKLPSKLRAEVAAMCDIKKVLRYATAWLIDVKLDPKDKEGKKKIFKANKAREEEQGIILDLTQQTIAESLSKYDKSKKLNIRHKVKGRYLKLTKKGTGKQTRYSIALGPKAPLKNTNLIKKYPDLEGKLDWCNFEYDEVMLEFLDTKLSRKIKNLEIFDNLKDPLGKKASKRKSRIMAELDDEDEEDYEDYEDEEEEDEEDDYDSDDDDLDEEEDEEDEDDYDDYEDDDDEDEDEDDEYDDEDEWDGDEDEDDDDFSTYTDKELVRSALKVSDSLKVRKCKAYYLKRKHLKESHREFLIELLEDSEDYPL